MHSDYVIDVLDRLDKIIEKLTAIEALLQPAAPVIQPDAIDEVSKAQTASDLLRLMRKR